MTLSRERREITAWRNGDATFIFAADRFAPAAPTIELMPPPPTVMKQEFCSCCEMLGEG